MKKNISVNRKADKIKSVSHRINKQLPPSTPKKKLKNKSSQIIPLIIGLLIGCFVGISAISFISKKTKSNGNSASIIEKNKSKTNQFPLLNPITSNDQYKDFSFAQLIPFKNNLNSFISAQQRKNPFIHISVYFRDFNTNAWFGINEYELFSPSSLMKVPVLIALLKKAEENPGYLSKKLIYQGSRENREKGMDERTRTSGTKLLVGQSYSLEELANEMIVNSDNEATFLILDQVELSYVESIQKKLGFMLDKKVAYFENIITVKGYSSFFRTLYNASFLNREMSSKALKLLSKAGYGYGIRRSVPSNIKVAHKYGRSSIPISYNEEIFEQLHHFGIVYYPGKPYILGVMTKGSDEKEMENIIYDISKLVFDEVDKQYKRGKNNYLDLDLE